MQGAHFLKGFWGENLRKNKEKQRKNNEHREIKGLTFLVLIFLIFLFRSTKQTIWADHCQILEGCPAERRQPVEHRNWTVTTLEWLATGRLLKLTGLFAISDFWGNLRGKTRLKIRNLKGEVQGGTPPPAPVPPPLSSRFVVTLLVLNFPKNCPVAIQWPVIRQNEDSFV